MADKKSIVDEMTDEEKEDFGPDDNDADDDKRPRKSQADRLVELAETVEFFHQDVDEPFASVHVGDHVETWGVHTKGFRRWLSREFWNHYKKAPGSQSIQDALNVLSGKAVHDGRQIAVHTRVAEHDGKLYLDLADMAWQAIEITSEGWSITKDVPVKFIRTRGMLEIPEPQRGGGLDDLRPFLNVADDDSFALIKAFLVSTLRPKRPFAFLVFTGEQGSGKTSLSIKLKSIVDPSKAPVRGLPRELRDLAIAAGNGWLLAYDNVSSIPTWISDALCSLSTGGGFGTRELYSDADEKIFDYQRPVILNGIGDIVTRPDLLDRSIVIQLPIIPEDKRRQESDLNRAFDKARPRILGALLDAAVCALRNQHTVELPLKPRMADFAVWTPMTWWRNDRASPLIGIGVTVAAEALSIPTVANMSSATFHLMSRNPWARQVVERAMAELPHSGHQPIANSIPVRLVLGQVHSQHVLFDENTYGK